jgi:hypothetical protein
LSFGCNATAITGFRASMAINLARIDDDMCRASGQIAYNFQPGFLRKRRAFRRVARYQGANNFAGLGLNIAATLICCDAFNFSSTMRWYSAAEQLPVAIIHQRRAIVSLDARAMCASINGPVAALRLAIVFLRRRARRGAICCAKSLNNNAGRLRFPQNEDAYEAVS